MFEFKVKNVHGFNAIYKFFIRMILIFKETIGITPDSVLQGPPCGAQRSICGAIDRNKVSHM